MVILLLFVVKLYVLAHIPIVLHLLAALSL